MKRVRPGPGALVLCAFLGGCGSAGVASGVADPGTPPAAEAPRHDADRTPVGALLAGSGVESVIDARARVFSRQVALLIGDLTDAELERLVPAVQAGFASDLLYRDIAAFVEAEAPPGRVEEVVGWLEGGASAEARRIIDAYDPPVPLEEWLGEYTSDPPTAVRVRLVARWTDARGSGDFFVLMEQALAEAAYAVRGQLRPGARPFRPLQGEALTDRLENSFNAAVVSALHVTETVPDSVLVGATEELESEAGRWYIETYQLAVAEAMRSAGVRVVDALAS